MKNNRSLSRVLLPMGVSLLAALCLFLPACQNGIDPADTTEADTPTATEDTVVDTDEGTTEADTQPVAAPLERSEYPKEQAGAKTETVLKAADFGVKGDGVTDDGPAICNAVNAAVKQQATLQFESGKTYYIGSATNNASKFASPFAIDGAAGITVDGGGSVFRFAPGISYFAVVGSSDVRLCNMKFDLSVSPYLVGTVKSVNGNKVTYTTDIEPYQAYNESHNYTNFSIEYNEGTQERPHRFINSIRSVGSKEVEVEYQQEGNGYEIGDKVFLPNPGIGNAIGEIVYIANNTGCLTFENIEVWAAPSFIANVRSNDAEIYFENVDYIPGAENNREIKMVSWRDGYHVKDNRRPIHWNECDVGVLFDDVFNVSNTLGYITAVKNSSMFTVTNYELYTHGSYVAFDCREGDVIDVFNAKGVYAGQATVRRVIENPNGTVDLVLGYGEELKKMEAGWLVGNRDTCAPGSTVTNSRFTGTFRFRREIRIENCVFDMLVTWIREDGSVEGPLPGNIDYVDCTFNGGNFDIGAAGASVRNAIRDIGFWNCTFNNDAKVNAGRGCGVTEAASWKEENLYTVKNRKIVYPAMEITPTEQDFSNTVVYDWTHYTMNVAGGQTLAISSMTDETLRDVLTNSKNFSDHVLVLTGTEGQTRFELSGVAADVLEGFHKNGFSYVVTLYYYITDGAPFGGAGYLNGEEAVALADGLFAEAGNTASVSFLYNAKDGYTGLYLDVPAGKTVYVGYLQITATSGKNPSFDELENGYTFRWTDEVTIGSKAEAMAYADIKDATVREAIQNAQSGFTSGTVLHVKGDLGDFTGLTDSKYYVQGKTYNLSLDVYIASAMVPQNGTKIYLLAMDDTAGNRVLAEGLFTGEGFYHFEMDWTVGNTGERSLKFFVSNTPSQWADLYIGDFTVTAAKSLKPDMFLDREDFHTLTLSELRDGYTFDFTEGNLLDTGVDAYASTDFLPAKTAALLRANGFGDVYYYCNENFTLQSLPNNLTGGRKYRITLQVYDVLGNLATTLPRGAMVLLHMQGGSQNSAEVSYTVQVSEADSRLLTITYEQTSPGGTDDLLFYTLTSVEFLVGSVTIEYLN